MMFYLLLRFKFKMLYHEKRFLIFLILVSTKKHVNTNVLNKYLPKSGFTSTRISEMSCVLLRPWLPVCYNRFSFVSSVAAAVCWETAVSQLGAGQLLVTRG